ncbi:E2F-associated phosphoprotein [Thalassophryne amazonica]|uniref:E2F-associated phosphoprotein n=1 Tax=Thalassophryne amazonica TaxID=390379 RepID=UPI001470F047|nr:E2F-associated phosphoprotein [Thalassophryne amazonica]
MNRVNTSEEFDSYEIEEPSDEERAQSSSEDELDVLLHGTPDQKKKLIREYLTGESESSSGDEFEREMEAELSSTMKTMEGAWGASAAGTSGGGVGVPQTYDKVYFDSDSEDDDTQTGSSSNLRRTQQLIPTNDELLYDPDKDDRDQAWVDARRRQYNYRKPQGGAPGSQHRPPQGLPNSDAILNCPACMTTLCLDCQRHETYRTQYRAMFVMNCTVKSEEVLHYKAQPPTKQRNRRKRQGSNRMEANDLPEPAVAGMDMDEVYHPVQCSECATEVAVFDKDEVYHFFNILASHC